jgi:hypothetical protein
MVWLQGQAIYGASLRFRSRPFSAEVFYGLDQNFRSRYFMTFSSPEAENLSNG